MLTANCQLHPVNCQLCPGLVWLATPDGFIFPGFSFFRSEYWDLSIEIDLHLSHISDLTAQICPYCCFLFFQLLLPICQRTFADVQISNVWMCRWFLIYIFAHLLIRTFGLWRITDSNRWPPACKAGALASWANPPRMRWKLKGESLKLFSFLSLSPSEAFCLLPYAFSYVT